MSKLIIGACALFLCLGCEKTADAPAGEKSAKPADKAATDKAKPANTPKAAEKAKPVEKKAAPAAAAWLKLDKLGVQIEMPAGSKAMPGAGDSLMISTAKGGCTVMLNKKSDTAYFPSYDSTVKSIEKGVTGKLKRMVKNEKTDDKNWVIQFEREGMIDPAKLKYGIDVRKAVGDAEYTCSRVSNTAEDAACVLKACQSLKAL